jgi:hypothetical protein
VQTTEAPTMPDDRMLCAWCRRETGENMFCSVDCEVEYRESEMDGYDD